MIGSALLVIPEVSLKTKVASIQYDDALFIATSSFTDTGLTPLNISQTYNVFGQILIMLFIQLGGIGIVAFKYLVWTLFLGRRTSLSDDNILHLEKGGTKRGHSTTIIRRALIMFFVVELIGFLFFTVYFISTNNLSLGSEVGDNTSPVANSGQAVFYGLFHSISAINNAGFDIFGGRSLAMFDHDQFIQVVTMILFIIGGMGFPIIYDLIYFLKARIFDNKRTKLMLLTKITVIGYFSVMIIGVLFAVISEGIVASNTDYLDETKKIEPLFNNRNYNAYEKWMILFFHTSSARSAGFSYYPMEALAPSTQTLMGILMFIGAGPSSTGGGVRVTSFFVVIAALFSFSRNKGEINIFKRTLSKSNRKSANRTILSSALIVIGIALLVILTMGASIKNTGKSSIQDTLFFETVSAFGTTGLSYKNITSSLLTIPKLLIALIMIIGQLGMNNVLTIFQPGKKTSRKYAKHFPIEHVIGV